MKTIHKYNIEITDEQKIAMPIGSVLLCAQIQKNALVLWAQVETSIEKEDVKIEVFGTGNPMPDGNRIYLSTVQAPMGFVWHIFYSKD